MKKIGIVSLLSAVLILTSGCSSASIETMDSNTYAYDAPQQEVMMSTAVFDGSSGTLKGAGGQNFASAPQNTSTENAENDLASRKIIKTASLSFETKEYDEFLVNLQTCIAQLGGYIESSEAYNGGIYSARSRNSYITARIPASSYTNFITQVTGLGTLTYQSESSDDVTLRYVDTESRIKSLQTEYDALLEILEKASSLDDVIQLQSRISEVTYQLESYQSQLRKYDDLISYCTVHIDISEVERVTQNKDVMSFGERISSGLSETFLDIEEDFQNFSVWLITSLPYILIWAVIITVLCLTIRLMFIRIKRKKDKKLIDQYLERVHEEKDSHNT